MDSLLEIYLNNADWEKVEAPKGAYMSGTMLYQTDLRENVLYKCKKSGHIKKFCPLNKNSSCGSGNRSGSGDSKGKSEKPKKKWYNLNAENKSTVEKKGKKYYWCKICDYG